MHTWLCLSNTILFGYTRLQLLDYLSLAGFLLCFGSITAAIFSAAMRRRRIANARLMPTATNSTAMPGRYAIPALRSAAAKLSSKLSTIGTRTRAAIVAAFFLLATLAVADGAPQCVKCGNSICCIDPR